MVKTAPMDEDTHTFFKKTQKALFEKYRINLSMSDIMADISCALRHPDEAAKMIMRARHTKHGDVISSEDKSGENNESNGSAHLKLIDKKDTTT